MSLPTFEVKARSGSGVRYWEVLIRRDDNAMFLAEFDAPTEEQARDIAQAWARMMEAVLQLPDAPLAEPFRRTAK